MCGPDATRYIRSVELIEANDAQKRERDLVTHAAWGSTLRAEDYAQREQLLRDHPWARSALRTWLLVSPHKGVLASCETYRMDSLIRDRPGQEPPGNAYAVASVFVEPVHRGRGHATLLLQLLSERLRDTDPSAHAMALYSDVGANLYERTGYHARPAFDLVLAPAAGDPLQGVDELIVEAEVPQQLRAAEPPPEGYVIWPTAAQLDWHLERSRFYARVHGRSRPAYCGARKGEARMFWHANFVNDALMVLLYVGGRDDAAPLLRSAQKVAARSGLREVRAWVTPLVERAAPGVDARIEPRDGSLPMLAPLHPAVRPEAWLFIPRVLWV